MFFPANEKAFLKHNHQLDFKAYKKKNTKENEVNFSTFYKPAQYWINKTFVHINNKKPVFERLNVAISK